MSKNIFLKHIFLKWITGYILQHILFNHHQPESWKEPNETVTYIELNKKSNSIYNKVSSALLTCYAKTRAILKLKNI